MSEAGGHFFVGAVHTGWPWGAWYEGHSLDQGGLEILVLLPALLI